MRSASDIGGLRKLRSGIGTAGVFLGLLWGWLAGCGRPAEPEADLPRLGAANSYLECAARDLLPAPVSFVRLAEPGMCPGHFDLRPSQVAELRRCRLLLRFDFQNSLDGRIVRSAGAGPRVISVGVEGGMCQPGSYLSVCERLAQALVAEGLVESRAAEARLKIVSERVNSGAARLRESVRGAGLSGLPVVTSTHQQAFCEELGLTVTATFRASDAARMSEVDAVIEAARKAGVKWVIANLPEGRRLADALASRLDAKVVVFGNFPDPGRSPAAFDALLESNVHALLAAARR